MDALNAGADGIILKTGELLTATDVQAVMDGKKLVSIIPFWRNSGTFQAVGGSGAAQAGSCH